MVGIFSSGCHCQIGFVVKIDFEPLGRRVEVNDSETILDAAQRAGLTVAAICGGRGTCGTCKIRLVSGELTPPTSVETQKLPSSALVSGFRLACQSRPAGDIRVEVPPESLTASQRILVEGIDSKFEFDPSIRFVSLDIEPPDNGDFEADDLRILKALNDLGFSSGITISPPIFPVLSSQLRSLEWKIKLAVKTTEPGSVIACLPVNAHGLGIACDMGSTKLAMYLADLETGGILARTGRMNPQISYGEDVVNRIAYCNTHQDGRQILQHRLIETLNEMIGDLCGKTGSRPEWIVDCVMVGNTAMHHFFAGFPVRQLGEAPFIPAVSQATYLSAGNLHLNVAPGAEVYLPPNIAGFVGSDHVAMLLAANSWIDEKTIVSMDIGTNTEISLLSGGKMYSCSCASGPAFEGAHIEAGMRAAAGAIERVQIRNGQIIWQTIENTRPVGICGSGILDSVAELKLAGFLDTRGIFVRDHPMSNRLKEKNRMVLIPAESTGIGKDIEITRRDINQIQLAKAAIQAGVKILLKKAGCQPQDIDDFFIAGAFGTYLDVDHSIEIGLLPDIPLERYHQMGNAAGVGACQLLFSKKMRKTAGFIANNSHYVELTIDPDFTGDFLDAMFLHRGY